MKRLYRPFTLACTCVALTASAQDLGLDLSEAKTPPEFRPSIGFIGVTPAEADAMLSARAKLLEAELFKAIGEAENFGVMKTPTDAAGVSTEARKCQDFACLDGLAEKMGVQRLVGATLRKEGPGTVLAFYGFDPALPAVLPAQVESDEKQDKAKMGGFAGLAGKTQQQRDKEFLIKAKPVFNEMLKALSTPLGKLSVDVIEAKAVTRWKGKDVGVGSFEKTLPAGAYELEVSADGYTPFNSTAKVEPMKTAQVKVTLIAKAVERPVAVVEHVEEGNPIYKRPGVFLAVAGVIAMAVGFGLGANAKSIEGRAVPGADGILPITRAQAHAATTDALLANILVPIGAAALAGGVVWAFVVPLFAKKPAAPPSGPAAPSEGGEGSGFGATFGFGARF
jgi:hypothetical protein